MDSSVHVVHGFIIAALLLHDGPEHLAITNVNHDLSRTEINIVGYTEWFLLDNDCSIKVYQSFVAIFKSFPIMLALCLML